MLMRERTNRLESVLVWSVWIAGGGVVGCVRPPVVGVMLVDCCYFAHLPADYESVVILR